MQNSKGFFMWKKMELYVTIIDKDKAEFVEQTEINELSDAGIIEYFDA